MDRRPASLVAADGTVYFYKEVKSDSAKTTGTVVAGTTTVKYVYEKLVALMLTSLTSMVK